MGNPVNSEALSLEDQANAIVEETPGELDAAEETDEAEAESEEE